MLSGKAMSEITIRAFAAEDWPAVWQMLEPVFRAGETYPYARDIPEAEARRNWIELPKATFVAVGPAGALWGTYYLKPNQPGQGAHVCNCGYVTAAEAQGRGVATALCTHSQAEAVRQGFRAMQFNLVVSTNIRAVRLWQHLGFARVGTLPGAFCHPSAGEVDAYVMYQRLVD
ncbi:MAG: N-acetyltransferase GCN5 [Puniceicoccaceae bacterium 5H]|nr:MAG: N-acetyltransferase GCN5 [Puniceicoccaceae bacterium 5H]